MQLGFVSAILPDLSLEEVFAFAADEGFGCVELMCWPPGGAERRYAGVTHLDVTQLRRRPRSASIRDLVQHARRRDLRPRLLSQPAHPDADAPRARRRPPASKVIDAAPRSA